MNLMDENLNQKSPLGTGEGEVPLSNINSPKIDMRTMASDMKSVEESGGIETRPYVPPPMTPSKKIEEALFQPSTIPAMEEKVFIPPSIESTQNPAKMDFPELKKQKSHKGFFVALITIIVIAGLGALGYFVVYPIFFQAPSVIDNTINPPVNPPITEQPPVEPPPVNPPASNHVSLLKISANATINEGESLPTLSPGSIIEVNTNTSKFFESFSETLKNLFSENEYTSFVYFDDGGKSANGSILKIKNGVSLSDAQKAWADSIENPQYYLTVFLSGSGAGEPQTWKTGQTGSLSNRYLLFSNPGFAINYGWVNDKVIITTSYNSFKEAVKRIQ